MKEVRVAIIGTGVISNRHMVIYESINKNAEKLGFRAKVVAAAELIPERLKAFGEKYGLEEKDLYTDFRKMIERDDIDTVDVCVHNNLHTPISIEVMKAGLDVYCEKPMAASWHDAKMMYDCAKKLGRKYQVQMSSVMNYQTRSARKMIQDGELGDIYYVNLEKVNHRRRPGYDMAMLSPDFCTARYAGHGVTIDLGVYLIGQILYILGLPELKCVNGFSRKALPTDDRLMDGHGSFSVEDIADGFATFANGTGFHILAASACNMKDHQSTYILGSKGGFEILNTSTGGGRYARTGSMNMAGRLPELKFYGDLAGRDVAMELNCESNEILEERLDPSMMLYNDNQMNWLAYKLGILTDETRINTPEIALRMLEVTDGIFLSEELRRTVTADEIRALSPALYVTEQQIGSELVRYDTEF